MNQQDDKQQNQQEDNSQQEGSQLDGNQQGNLSPGLQNMDPDELEELQGQFGNNASPGDIPDDGRGGNGRGTSGMFGTGDPGVLRLFSTELSGQISFLLPFVLLGVMALAVQFFRKREWSIQHKFALFWVAWLIPMMVFFSIAQFFHQYYLSMMGANMGGSNAGPDGQDGDMQMPNGGPKGQMDGGTNSSERSSNNSQSEENTDSAVQRDNRQPEGQGRGPMETLDTKLLSYLGKNYDDEKRRRKIFLNRW